MQDSIFTHSGWDVAEPRDFIFYEVTLKIDIGCLVAGESFDSAVMDYIEGKMTLTKGSSSWSFLLKMEAIPFPGQTPRLPDENAEVNLTR